MVVWAGRWGGRCSRLGAHPRHPRHLSARTTTQPSSIEEEGYRPTSIGMLAVVKSMGEAEPASPGQSRTASGGRSAAALRAVLE